MLKFVFVYFWDWLKELWDCLYIDFVGFFMNLMFLFIIDVYLKWVESFLMNSIIIINIIEKLCVLFF